MDILSIIGNVCSIAGILFTFILWLRVDRFKEEVELQRINYVKTQRSILTNLKALRTNIFADDLLSIKTVSKLREELFAMQNDFGRILKEKDKACIDSTIAMLDSNIESIDNHNLLRNLDYLIARFRKKEA